MFENTTDDATVYSDEASAYERMSRTHASVKHGVGEYVLDMARTNGMESFWAMLKRAYIGTYHKLSSKHLDRYITEFSGGHKLRERNAFDQMGALVAWMVGKTLRYIDLIEDNGLASGARVIWIQSCGVW